MNTFDVKKRNLLSYKEFMKNTEKAEKAKHIEKGEHEIVKKAMNGEKKGDKGIATLDESGINESLPPTINFNEHEVFNIITEITDNKLSSDDSIKLFQEKLKEKGRSFTNDCPPGAYM